jgi:hypothetical protein
MNVVEDKASSDTPVCCNGFCAYTYVTGKPCPRVSTKPLPRRP